MTGHLATFVGEEFKRMAPRGVAVEPEQCPIDDHRVVSALGYRPACDLRVTRTATGERLWVELEISRADPVANHAKFATAHMVSGQAPNDAFVSLMTRGVDPGRRSLGAHAVYVLRRLGMHAFQTPLLPQLPSHRIRELNHLPLAQLRALGLDLRPDWDRLLAVTKAVFDGPHRIFYAGDDAEVVWNAARWNAEIEDSVVRSAWGRRPRDFENFVVIPGRMPIFAPAKFCAFVPADGSHGMTVSLYCTLSEAESRFDGHKAWKHLERLGWTGTPLVPGHPLRGAFDRWIAGTSGAVRVRGAAPVAWQAPT